MRYVMKLLRRRKLMAAHGSIKKVRQGAREIAQQFRAFTMLT